MCIRDSIYVLTRGGDGPRLDVLDLADGPAAGRRLPGSGLTLPPDGRSITVHPGGGYALVGGDTGTVHVLDLADPARPRLAGSAPDLGVHAGPVFRPDGRSALCLTADGVRDIVLGPPRVVHTWPVPGGPRAVAVSADGTRLFVTRENGGDLLMLDTRTGTPRFTVPAGTALAVTAAHPTRELALVSDEGGGAVVAIDTSALSTAGHVDVGLDPRSVVRGSHTT